MSPTDECATQGYSVWMRIISQRELRNDNAEVMRGVEAGETFVVTRHGKPVARVVPAGDPELPLASEPTVRGGFSSLPRVTLEVSTSEVLDDLRGER